MKKDSIAIIPIRSGSKSIKNKNIKDHNKDLGFNYSNFAKDIIKKSKVRLFLVNDQYQLAKFIKSNDKKKKIVIGMGAGTISAWMKELPKLIL